jgi:ribosomal protein S12 methylthiotransferase
VKTIHFVSLGCPKNRVDSEVMLGVAEGSGYRHVEDAETAEVIVVNTCGFIESAKRESIDTILELMGHKQSGACKKLVVAGCLSQRYPEELASELPEVDHFLGSSDMLSLARVLDGQADRVLVGSPAAWVLSSEDPRRLSTRGASAYVKIAEGCNRQCSFCVIPQLRGKQRSRQTEDIVREVERLAAAGVLEVNLVSQDTIAYGRDLDEKADLAALVARIAEVPGLRWVRLHYLYPETLTKPLVELLGQHPKVLPYVDMPLQHAADAMLRRMKRGHGGDRLRTLVERLRREVPDLVFRTAFIVGHPGESEEEYAELLEFVRWAEFDRVGVFQYSDEPECGAHAFDAKVPSKTAEQRAKKLLSVQRAISKKKLKALVGRELDVLVEGPSEESELVMAGRYYGQAPDIDGVVYLSGAEVLPGQMRRVEVVKTTDYDLLGEVIDPDPEGHAARAAQNVAVPVANLVQRTTDGRRVALKTVG